MRVCSWVCVCVCVCAYACVRVYSCVGSTRASRSLPSPGRRTRGLQWRSQIWRRLETRARPCRGSRLRAGRLVGGGCIAIHCPHRLLSPPHPYYFLLPLSLSPLECVFMHVCACARACACVCLYVYGCVCGRVFLFVFVRVVYYDENKSSKNLSFCHNESILARIGGPTSLIARSTPYGGYGTPAQPGDGVLD